jgi:hypothetical protein
MVNGLRALAHGGWVGSMTGGFSTQEPPMSSHPRSMFPSLVFVGWLSAYAWVVVRFVA